MQSKEEADRISHMNPARKKIPFPICRRGFTFGHCRSTPKSVESKHYSFNTPLTTATTSQLCTTLTHYNSLLSLIPDAPSNNLQQHQQLLQENRFLLKQLATLRTTNKQLLQRVDEKQAQLLKTDQEYRQLRERVSEQNERASTSMQVRILDESKHSEQHRTTNEDENNSSRAHTHFYTTSRRNKSKQQLYKLRQTFQNLDFSSIQRIASKRKNPKTAR